MPRRLIAFALALSSTVACAKDTRRAAPAPSESAPVTATPRGLAPSPSSFAPDDGAPPSRRRREACRAKFSGAEESEFVGTWFPMHKDNDVTAASDYWATEAEMRTALRAGMAGSDAGEAARLVEDRMGNDPRVVILELRCVTERGAVIIVSSGASKYADIPFKPGTYKLGTGTVKTAPAGDFVVARVRSATAPYIDVKPGTLTLTKFDGTGVAGSFSFRADSAATKTPAKIEGTFDLPCEPNRFGQCRLGG